MRAYYHFHDERSVAQLLLLRIYQAIYCIQICTAGNGVRCAIADELSRAGVLS
jgi:hypothetical protein